VDDPRFPLLEAAGLPVVVAGHPASACPFPWVETAHDAGMRAAAEHLAALGHEHIAFLGGPEALEFVQVRLTRWREGLEAAGVAPGPVLHAEAGGETAAVAAAALDSGVTAVACTSDALAVSVVNAARDAGRRVPDELSVTGFDDSALAALASPPLTSVHVDYAEFGAAAAAALVARVDAASMPAYSPSAPELVLRASTASPRR
jgi:DNA-binding LacI/PurR family transcriptional regulator